MKYGFEGNVKNAFVMQLGKIMNLVEFLFGCESKNAFLDAMEFYLVNLVEFTDGWNWFWDQIIKSYLTRL